MRGQVGKSSSLTLVENREACAEELARFFPRLRPVRIPVQVTSKRGGNNHLRETTVVEFAGKEHAIFLSTLPLEFDDRVLVQPTVNGHSAETNVVAVQYHEGRKAVAVRFLGGPCDWVVTHP